MMAQIVDRKYLKAQMRELLSSAQVSPKAMAALYLLLSMAIGFLAGFLGLLIRGFGRYPESMAFAILICNAVAPALDWALTGGKAAAEDGGQGARD